MQPVIYNTERRRQPSTEIEVSTFSQTLVTITMYMNFSVCPYVGHKLMCKAKHSGFYEENAKISIMAKTFTNTLVILY